MKSNHKVLVIQGAGMDMRGRSQVEIFGPETIEEINARVLEDAAALDMEVEIFQSNDESSVVAKLQAATPAEFAALVINPSGFTTTDGPLPEAIARLDIPAFEVHASNPASRGVRSTLQPVCRGAVCGFGYAGYGIALRAIREQINHPDA